MKTRAVYMALLGGYEELLEQPMALETDIPFICLTDNVELTSKTWQVRHIDPRFPSDLTRSARYLKIMGHPSLDEFDETLWIDNTVELRTAPDEILDNWLSDHDLAVPLHSYRASVIGEIEAVIDHGRDDPARLYEQLIHYQRWFPEQLGRNPHWTGMLARRSAEGVTNAMQTWWEHVLRFSRRDQISFNVATSGIAIREIRLDNFESPLHSWPRSSGRAPEPSRSIGHAMRPAVAEVGQLQNALDEVTTQLAHSVAGRESEIHTLRAELAAIRGVFDGADPVDVRLQADALSSQLEQTRLAAELAGETAANLRAELDATRRTISWRITAPLRVARRISSRGGSA